MTKAYIGSKNGGFKMDNEIIKDTEIIEPETVPEEKQAEEKLFKQDEVNEIVQKRLSKEIKKFKETLEKEKSEAEKLAKMSEQERLEAEFQKQKEAFELERKGYLREKLELQTIKELSNIDMPTEFSKLVLADDADTTKENIKFLQSVWSKALDAEVNKRLSGVSPKASVKSELTKVDFDNMSLAERTKLFNENLELYNKLK